MERYGAIYELYRSVDIGHNNTVLGTPSTGKFTYPAQKTRTEANVTAMRAAEANLDNFWKAIDERFDGVSRPRLQDLLRKKGLQRTPVYVAPQRHQKHTTNPPLEIPWSQYNYELQRRTEATTTKGPLTVASKEKVKTRGAEVPQNVTQALAPIRAPPDVVPNKQETVRKISVRDRSLKVFRTLFFTPNAEISPGELSWKDFCQAMFDVGFSAKQLYGSVWQFAPTNETVAGCSIQFHEPHPNDKIRYLVARHFGRRLSRTFQWSWETFEKA